MSDGPRRFEHEDLREQDFQHADLADAVFVDCRLAGARFRGADLTGARFTGCRGWEADAPAGTDFAFATLNEASFERCELSMAVFSRARGYDLLLDECQAQGADFSHLDTRMPVATRIPTVACTLRGCNLAYADLSGVDLSGADLSGSRLTEAVLDDCSLRDADLSGCDLHNLSGRRLVLAGADLRGATFNCLDPRLLDLSGVRITPEQVPMLLAPLGVIIDVSATA
ncbi:MAG: pentapeptide repeat-containing protein [Pseudomonadales bacterium]